MQPSTRTTLIALALTLVPALAPAAALAAQANNASNAQQQQSVYTLTINNNTGSRQELQVAGKTYSVPSRYNLIVTAVAGTGVDAASTIGSHPSGSLIHALTAQDNNNTLDLN
jgi:hypothetical protein